MARMNAASAWPPTARAGCARACTVRRAAQRKRSAHVRPDAMDRKFDYPGLLIAAGFFVLFAAQLLMLRPTSAPIAYSDFHQLVAARLVDDLEVGPVSISGTLKMPQAGTMLPASEAAAVRQAGAPWRFTTNRVTDEHLTDTLTAAGIRYHGAPDTSWVASLASWLLPLVLFVFIWNMMLRRRGGLQDFTGMGKSRARVYVQQETGITFDDIAGIDEAKAELQQLVAFLRNPDRYQRLGGKIPKGVLVVGAPGTGKTLLRARWPARRPCRSSRSAARRSSRCSSAWARRVRDLFEQAQQKAPCIVFVDAMRSAGARRRPDVGQRRTRADAQSVARRDGRLPGRFRRDHHGRDEPAGDPDPALLRPGRFDRHIAIDRPDVNGRRQILGVHVKRVKLADDVDLGELASRTPGFVGADLANVVNEAALHAAELGKQAIGMADFDEAIDRALTGLERKSRVMNAQEKLTIAYHEAGHALVAESRTHCDPVKKVSIIPRGVAALGYTQQVPTEDRYVLRRSELLDRIDALLGGRAAEELVFGDVSTGAQNDLERATAMARHMVMQYGMSEKIAVTFDDGDTRTGMPGVWHAGDGRCSEHTARMIDDEVHTLLTDAHPASRPRSANVAMRWNASRAGCCNAKCSNVMRCRR